MLETPRPRAGLRARTSRHAPSLRTAVVATGVLIVCATPFAAADTGDPLREGVRNGTTDRETEMIGDLAASPAAKGGFVTRQSNLSSTGGGAIYGCRANEAATSDPCVRASNLSTGRAFEFNSNTGPVVGLITAGAGGDTKKPFQTNATGVANGLNADRLDSLHASEIVSAARAKSGLDADSLDGKDSTQIVSEARAKSGLDADTVDGQDASALGAGFAVFDDDNVTSAAADVEVESLSLPAGSFIVHAFTNANNNSGAGDLVDCRIELGGTTIASTDGGFRVGPNGSDSDRHAISLSGGGTLGSPGEATLICNQLDSGNYLAQGITATRVISVN